MLIIKRACLKSSLFVGMIIDDCKEACYYKNRKLRKEVMMENYLIENDVLAIKINPIGAELFSIQSKLDAYEYLWQGHKEFWARRAPILFPIVGKLKDTTYKINGKTYHMTQHGFARDEMFKVIFHEKNKIVFELREHTETLKSYPYNFKLHVTYVLEGTTLTTKYKVENLNDEIMPFSIGAHPAFNLMEKNQFKFETDEINTYMIRENGIDTKTKKIMLKSGLLDITADLFKDDALILKNTETVILKTDHRSILLKCDGFPYLGLWSKATGAPFVCLEPWYGLGDLINHNQNIFEKEGIMVLPPHEIFKSEFHLTLE